HQRPVRLVDRQQVVDQSRAHALALDAVAVLGVSAQPFEIDHASSSRICARNPSTHAAACFSARPTARRRSAPASAGPPTGYEPRNFTSPCLVATLRRAAATNSSAT